jgi:hypothetical protein
LENSRAAHLASHLERYKARYDNGDKAALLEAVEFCALFKLVMPEWVAYWFTSAHREWKRLNVKTLDEAFEVQRPSNFRLATEREFFQKSFDVYMALLAAEDGGKSLSNCKNGVIEEVAKEFGINRDKVWKMNNHIRRNTSIGREFEKTRKKRKKPT